MLLCLLGYERIFIYQIYFNYEINTRCATANKIEKLKARFNLMYHLYRGLDSVQKSFNTCSSILSAGISFILKTSPVSHQETSTRNKSEAVQ